MDLALFEHNQIREKHFKTGALKLTEDLAKGAKEYAEHLRLVLVSRDQILNSVRNFGLQKLFEIENQQKRYAWVVLWL